MPLHPATLQQFTDRQEEICNADPCGQPSIPHSVEKWRKGLVTSPIAARHLESCIEFLGRSLTVSRQSVFDAVQQGLDPQARFLMQMIWGNVPSDGRAPLKMRSYFESPTIHQPGEYQRAVDDVHAGRIEAAFHRLMAVPGLSTSFVSKVLYFESRHALPEANRKYALIMDDRVSNGLIKLTSPWGYECVETLTPRPLLTRRAGARRRHNQIDKTWKKYWAYVESCHELAEHLGTHGDYIECFLFKEGSRAEA